MVLVGGPAMVEAVRTTQSTFGIWVIVAVAMISLAVWLVGVYVADSYQTRLSRQRRRVGAPGPALTGADAAAPAEASAASAASSSIPGQRREAGQAEPEPASASASASASTSASASETGAARGKHARPGDYYAAADYYEAADYKAAEKPPAGNPETSPRGVGEPATGSQADAPTRPDLPAQAAPTGRHAMPTQRSGDSDPHAMPTERSGDSDPHAMPTERSGDSDRAERTYAGPEANREDDEDDEDQR
jgi:hypothetical protein